MNETIIDNLPDLIMQHLKEMRNGDWLTLWSSPLAHTPFVEAMFLTGEPISNGGRARILKLMLQWSIDRLKPEGTQSWTNRAWRHYNLLHAYYIDNWRVADIAEALAIADQTFYEWRNQAIMALSHVIQSELTKPAHEGQRQIYVLSAQYRSLTPPLQQVLRLLSLLEGEAEMPVQWLYELLPEAVVVAVLPLLINTHFIHFDTVTQQLRLRTQLQQWLMPQLLLAERVMWQQGLATLYKGIGAYVTAATHLHQAGNSVAAAHLIVTQQQAIFDQKQASALQTLLKRFEAFAFTDNPTLWAQLQIVAGKAAEFLEDVATAIAAYGIALAAPDLLTKARAYYYRAKALQRTNLDECLSHYTVCMALTERPSEETPALQRLRTRIYIDRGWIYIQERPDFSQAQQDLAYAEKIIPANDSALWSDLYNAQASLLLRQDNLSSAIEKRLLAWVAASESQQVELMMKTAYNLGTDYIWDKQYTTGLMYLEKCATLAEETGHITMQGAALKGIGNCHAWEGSPQTAVSYYHRAYDIFDKGQYSTYTISLCLDLAEAYAQLDQYPIARRYLGEGQQLADQLGHERYHQDIEELRQQYPRLAIQLNERQQLALNYVKEHGEINRSQYLTLVPLSKSQAHRDLEALCQWRILQRVGKGRATKYIEVK